MGLNTISMIISGFSILMCLVLAYFLLFTELLAEGMSGNKKIILVIILISYAIFRSFRLYAMMNKKNKNSGI
jgi:hypothetical protein